MSTPAYKSIENIGRTKPTIVTWPGKLERRRIASYNHQARSYKMFVNKLRISFINSADRKSVENKLKAFLFYDISGVTIIPLIPHFGPKGHFWTYSLNVPHSLSFAPYTLSAGQFLNICICVQVMAKEEIG